MGPENEFFIHVDDTPKRLYVTRTEKIKSKALSPCEMTPDDVDYEMDTGKNREILEIVGMNQESLEYFVRKYGKTYRYLKFFKSQLIRDFSPLEDLENLEEVNIWWNIRADKLWDFSRNGRLRTISVHDAKKLTRNLHLLKTSRVLKKVWIGGGFMENFPLDSLDCFAEMPEFRHLRVHNVRLMDHNVDFLKTVPNLERFDFDAGMFTTEEIAWMVAKYPELSGASLCAYNTEDAVLNDVRVCGYRKPGLDLPEGQKRLDKYVAQFEALVERYRNEL